MTVDNLSNMLSRIKNASMVGKEYIEIFHTKECEAVAKVLKEEGYLTDVKVFKESGRPFKRLHIGLAYLGEERVVPVINDVKRVSKPGRRVYKGYGEIRDPMGIYGVSVVSTSRGVMTDKEARRKKLGGEIICRVY